MTHTVKVFMSGNSQVVRLPKEFQFSGKEVQIQRVGNAIVLLPVSDPWDNFRNSLDQFSDDFMEDGRRQPMACTGIDGGELGINTHADSLYTPLRTGRRTLEAGRRARKRGDESSPRRSGPKTSS